MGIEVLYLIVFFICLLGSAFFSAAETSLTSIDHIDIERLTNKYGNKAVEILKKVMDSWESVIITLLLFNNVMNITAASAVTLLLTQILGSDMMVYSAGISTLLVTAIILLFGEVLPKTLARSYSDIWSLVIAKTIFRLMYVASPIVKLINILSKGLFHLFGIKMNLGAKMTQEELVAVVEAGEKQGLLKEQQGNMFRGILGFGDTAVHKIMVPRVEMIVLKSSMTLKEVIEIVQEYAFSRMPVVGEDVDKVKGVCHVKDLFAYIQTYSPKEDSLILEEVIREVVFVAESKKLREVFKEFQKHKAHMGIVVDEYGGTAGLVTIEDLIEQIVGEIYDEHDEEDELIIPMKEGNFLVDARVTIANFNRFFGQKIPEKEHYDTLGGFIISEKGGIPEKGEQWVYKGMELKMISRDEKKIGKVKVHPLEGGGRKLESE